VRDWAGLDWAGGTLGIPGAKSHQLSKVHSTLLPLGSLLGIVLPVLFVLFECSSSFSFHPLLLPMSKHLCFVPNWCCRHNCPPLPPQPPPSLPPQNGLLQGVPPYLCPFGCCLSLPSQEHHLVDRDVDSFKILMQHLPLQIKQNSNVRRIWSMPDFVHACPANFQIFCNCWPTCFLLRLSWHPPGISLPALWTT
jgi:hypothetical protein